VKLLASVTKHFALARVLSGNEKLTTKSETQYYHIIALLLALRFWRMGSNSK
jgi:hypothetical protein